MSPWLQSNGIEKHTCQIEAEHGVPFHVSIWSSLERKWQTKPSCLTDKKKKTDIHG